MRFATAAFALFVAPLLTTSVVAHATIVERVVAIVGERPILVSDLHKRARP